MAFDKHGNLVKVTVTVAPSPATSGTTLSISNTDATALTTAGLTAPFNMVAQPTSSATETNVEIIRVTAIGAADSGGTGNTQLTITRTAETQPGSARSILVGDYLTNNITTKVLTDIENNINGFIYDETPSGTVNGTNTTFTLANTPISGSLQLYRDGQLMNGGGNDYTLSGSTITFTTAPVSGSVLLAYYSKAATGSGVNAATVNGYSANATPTANQVPVLDAQAGIPAAAYNGGWIYSTDTLTYASANSVTISGVDRTAVYTKGTRVKFTNNGVTYYGVVISSTFSTNTTITFAPNNDYSIANSAITNPYYSYMANPQGYPGWFNFTPTITWTNPITSPTIYAMFSIIERQCQIVFRDAGTANASSAGATVTLTNLPASNVSTNSRQPASGSASWTDNATFTDLGAVYFNSGTNAIFDMPNATRQPTYLYSSFLYQF